MVSLMLAQPSSVLSGVLMATGVPLLKSNPELKPKGQKVCCACAEHALTSRVMQRTVNRVRMGLHPVRPHPRAKRCLSDVERSITDQVRRVKIRLLTQSHGGTENAPPPRLRGFVCHSYLVAWSETSNDDKANTRRSPHVIGPQKAVDRTIIPSTVRGAGREEDLHRTEYDPERRSHSAFPSTTIAARTLGALPMWIRPSTTITGRFRKVYSCRMYLR